MNAATTEVEAGALRDCLRWRVDPYIDDFATKITDQMDVTFSACEGWPGIRSPNVKDWIVEHQIPAKGWYVAHPDLAVRDIRRLKDIGKAVDEFLDKVGN